MHQFVLAFCFRLGTTWVVVGVLQCRVLARYVVSESEGAFVMPDGWS